LELGPAYLIGFVEQKLKVKAFNAGEGTNVKDRSGEVEFLIALRHEHVITELRHYTETGTMIVTGYVANHRGHYRPSDHSEPLTKPS
jgi:hypothetical protein